MEKFLSDSIQGVDVLSSFKIKTLRQEKSSPLMILRDYTKTIPGVSSALFLVRGGGPSSRERMVLSMNMLDVLKDYTNSVSTVAPVSWQVFNDPALHAYLIRRLTDCNLYDKKYFSNDPLPGIGELVSFRFRGGIPQNIIFPIGASTVNWLSCVKSSRRMGEILTKRPTGASDVNRCRNIRLVAKRLANTQANLKEDDTRRLRFWRYFYFLEDATERVGMMHHNPFAMSHVSFDINMIKASPMNEHDFSLAFMGDCFSRESVLLSDIVCGGRTSNFFPLLQAVIEYKYNNNNNKRKSNNNNTSTTTTTTTTNTWTDIWKHSIGESGYKLSRFTDNVMEDTNDPAERLKHIIKTSNKIHNDKKHSIVDFTATVLHFSHREILNNITISPLAIKEEVEEFLLVTAIKQEWILLYSLLQQIQFNILHFIGYQAHRILIFKLFVPVLIAVLFTNGNLSQTVVHAAVNLNICKKQAGCFTLSNILSRSTIHANPVGVARHFSQFDENDAEGFVSSTLSVPLVTDVANMFKGLSSKMDRMDFFQKYGMSVIKARNLITNNNNNDNDNNNNNSSSSSINNNVNRKSYSKKEQSKKENIARASSSKRKCNTDSQRGKAPVKRKTKLLIDNDDGSAGGRGGGGSSNNVIGAATAAVVTGNDNNDDDDDDDDDDDGNNPGVTILANDRNRATTSSSSAYDPGEGCSHWGEVERNRYRDMENKKNKRKANKDDNPNDKTPSNGDDEEGDPELSRMTLSGDRENEHYEKIQNILKKPSKKKDYSNDDMPSITLKGILNVIEECFGITKGTIITSIHANVRDYSVIGNRNSGGGGRSNNKRKNNNNNNNNSSGSTSNSNANDNNEKGDERRPIDYRNRNEIIEGFLELIMDSPCSQQPRRGSNTSCTERYLHNEHLLEALRLNPVFRAIEGTSDSLERVVVLWNICKYVNMVITGLIAVDLASLIDQRKGARKALRRGTVMKQNEFNYREAGNAPGEMRDTIVPNCISKLTCIAGVNYKKQKCHHFFCRSLKLLFTGFDPDRATEIFIDKASQNTLLRLRDFCRKKENPSMRDWNEQVFKPIARGDGWVTENEVIDVNVRQPKDFSWLLKKLIIEKELLTSTVSKKDVEEESNKMRPMGFYREPYFQTNSDTEEERLRGGGEGEEEGEEEEEETQVAEVGVGVEIKTKNRKTTERQYRPSPPSIFAPLENTNPDILQQALDSIGGHDTITRLDDNGNGDRHQRHRHHHHHHNDDDDSHRIIESPVTSTTLEPTIDTVDGPDDNITGHSNADDDDEERPYVMSPITFPSFDDSDPFDTALASTAGRIDNDEDKPSHSLDGDDFNEDTTTPTITTTITTVASTRPPTTTTTTTNAAAATNTTTTTTVITMDDIIPYTYTSFGV
uniref:Wsv037-like protein n=1 Tax=Penaeus semisulcatus majanivirus TaxID=2984274 RepID=A0A9C7BQ21_9VIRU|nr:MAG: wsv037-like protein [Penaeus semisulcatus majanivirus]